MKRVVASAVVAALILALGGHRPLSAVPAQKAKKGQAPKVEVDPRRVEPIDPHGEPRPAVIRSTSGPKVCLGYNRDGWTIRLRAGNAGWTRINGQVEVLGGQLTKITGFESLETTPKKKSDHLDRGRYDRQHIEFEFWVRGASTDSFNFDVSEAARYLRFRFWFNGGALTRDGILIGREGERPSQGEFFLPARPDRPADGPPAQPAQPPA
jgi:hypothetical protein